MSVASPLVLGLAQRSASAAREIKALKEASIAQSRSGAEQADTVAETVG
ncbi:hypothetical protein [Paraburkholderia adhaesiva]|nr:hypothetical protein [Paraburkholderia adhaesiva]